MYVYVCVCVCGVEGKEPRFPMLLWFMQFLRYKKTNPLGITDKIDIDIPVEFQY